MLLLDTCALLWWTLEPGRLSPAATRACAAAAGKGIAASSISVWEIGIKVRKKKLHLPLTFREYVERLGTLSRFELLPVTARLWADSIELAWDNPDPADRVIVATAGLLGAPIVTKDALIREFFADTVW
jgi:PIN domain nuclease of toxin-antitoxin system